MATDISSNLSLGTYHNLLEQFEKLNQEYFDNKILAFIRWGKKSQKIVAVRKKSITLGTYCTENKLITINRALDQAMVPRLCVERIIYHEMLHQIYPVKIGRYGRRQIHTREFKQAEKAFLGASMADRWISQNLSKMLLRA